MAKKLILIDDKKNSEELLLDYHNINEKIKNAAHLEEELSRKNSDYESIKSKLETTKSELKKIIGLKCEFESENTVLKNQLKEKDTLLKKYSDYESIKRNLETINSEIKKIKNQNTELESENKKLSEQNNDYFERLKRANEQHIKNDNDIKKMTEELNKLKKSLETKYDKMKSENPVDKELQALDSDEQRYYYNIYLNHDYLDCINDIKYLSVSIDLSGSLLIYPSANYKKAQIIQLKYGKILPNPYFFTEFVSDIGEYGESLKKISRIFNFNTDISDKKKYKIFAVSPAYVENYGDKILLVNMGRIWINENK